MKQTHTHTHTHTHTQIVTLKAPTKKTLSFFFRNIQIKTKDFNIFGSGPGTLEPFNVACTPGIIH